MKVLIATKNPAKISGAKNALNKFFDNIEIEGIAVSSNVPDQPVNEQAYLGAKNRIKNLKAEAKAKNISADLYMSIETGIINLYDNWLITNFAIIEDNLGHTSCATSPSFPVPTKLVQDIIDTNLNDVISKIFKEDNERHNSGGSISLLTHNNVSRIELTETAFIMALTKFVNADKWQ